MPVFVAIYISYKNCSMSIYSSNTDCTRILYLKSVQGINSIQIVDESENFDEVVYQFSYSIDKSTWSEYVDTVPEILTLIDSIEFANINIYLRIKLTIIKNTKSQSFAYYELQKILINNESIEVTNIEISNNSNILINSSTKNLFNPYRNTDQQKELYDKMSKSISDIFGFEVIYFSTEPEESSKDITFRSYRLSSVKKYAPLKVVINNNELPGNRLQFSELNIDFQDELEIHVVKEVYWAVFGQGKAPSSNDFMYLPLTNRMYEVNTSSSGDLFMNHAPFWKAFLVKYENRANVSKAQSVQDEIDEYANFDVDFEKELYGHEKSSATKAFNNVKHDDRDDVISDNTIEIDGLNFVKWSYNYESVLNTAIAMSYPAINDRNEFSIMVWIQLNETVTKILNVKDSMDRNVISLNYANGLFNVVLQVEQTSIQFNLAKVIEHDIDYTEFYGVVLNYAYGENKKLLTCTILDQTLEVIQEVADDNIPMLNHSSVLQIYGGYRYANLRMSKQFTTRSKMSALMIDQLPDTNNFIVLDNATPQLTEPQTKC